MKLIKGKKYIWLCLNIKNQQILNCELVKALSATRFKRKNGDKCFVLHALDKFIPYTKLIDLFYDCA